MLLYPRPDALRRPLHPPRRQGRQDRRLLPRQADRRLRQARLRPARVRGARDREPGGRRIRLGHVEHRNHHLPAPLRNLAIQGTGQ